MPPKSRKTGEISDSVTNVDKSRNKSMTKTKGSLYAKEPQKQPAHPLQKKLDKEQGKNSKNIMTKFSDKLTNFEIQLESNMQKTELKSDKLTEIILGADPKLL